MVKSQSHSGMPLTLAIAGSHRLAVAYLATVLGMYFQLGIGQEIRASMGQNKHVFCGI